MPAMFSVLRQGSKGAREGLATTGLRNNVDAAQVRSMVPAAAGIKSQ